MQSFRRMVAITTILLVLTLAAATLVIGLSKAWWILFCFTLASVVLLVLVRRQRVKERVGERIAEKISGLSPEHATMVDTIMNQPVQRFAGLKVAWMVVVEVWDDLFYANYREWRLRRKNRNHFPPRQ